MIIKNFDLDDLKSDAPTTKKEFLNEIEKTFLECDNELADWFFLVMANSVRRKDVGATSDSGENRYRQKVMDLFRELMIYCDSDIAKKWYDVLAKEKLSRSLSKALLNIEEKGIKFKVYKL